MFYTTYLKNIIFFNLKTFILNWCFVSYWTDESGHDYEPKHFAELPGMCSTDEDSDDGYEIVDFHKHSRIKFSRKPIKVLHVVLTIET